MDSTLGQKSRLPPCGGSGLKFDSINDIVESIDVANHAGGVVFNGDRGNAVSLHAEGVD